MLRMGSDLVCGSDMDTVKKSAKYNKLIDREDNKWKGISKDWAATKKF